MESTKLLGELEVELGDKKVTLKPTFKGIILMEELSGKTISELVNTFMSMRSSIRDVAAIIYGGMYGFHGNDAKKVPMTHDQVGEAVMAVGHANLTLPCSTIVGCVYSGVPIDDAVKQREARKAAAKEPEAKNGEAPKP